MMLVYCETCGFRIAPEDLDRGYAVQVEENRYLCAKCNPTKTPSQEIKAARSTPSQTRIPRQTPKAPAASPRPPTASHELRPSGEIPKAANASAVRKVAKDSPKSKSLPVPVIAGAGAAAVLLIVVLLWPSKKTPVPEVAASNDKTTRVEETKPAQAPTPPTPTVTDTTPKTPPQPTDRVMPSWMHKTTVQEASSRRPTTQGQRDEGDSTIFIEDALPPKAEENGTANVRFISWKWLPKPHPVFSGDFSHTISLPGDPTEKVHQHYFEHADPPLLLTEQDVFFAYVYIDPAMPPKTIMMQWNENKNWEHRAYWGEDKIPFGENDTASRKPQGPLPKFGEWVRLEVPVTSVGFSGNGIAISGWSFDHYGGRVYWDKVGVRRKSPKPGAAVTPAAPPVIASPSAASIEGQISLGKVEVGAIQGGRDHPNFKGKNVTGKAIWAKPTPVNALSAKFQAADAKYGVGTLSLFCLRHGRTEPCRMALIVNGTTILDGVDAAEGGEWQDRRYAIPEGVIKSGVNEVRVLNMEERGGLGGDPWIMINSIELFAALAK